MDLPSGEDEAWLKAMEVATLCSLPMALKAAVELNVLDIIAQHGGLLSAAQIAQHVLGPSSSPTHAAAAATSLERIMRLLPSHGLLSCSLYTCPDGSSTTTYGLHPASRLLLQHNESHGSLAPFVLVAQDPVFMQCFVHLREAILDGGLPFAKAHAMPLFNYTQRDARFDALFNLAMAGHTKLVMETLLKTYQGFQNINTLVDVGGGNGVSLSMIVARYPNIKGINFDQPHVIASAPKYPGVEHVGGDIFKEIPQADAIFMKWILHDWSDTYCIKILENCNKALPKQGKVIVVDAILPTQVKCDLRTRVNYQMDLLMFLNTHGGKERTKEELEYLAKASGFQRFKFICNVHGVSVVELFKESI